eukprot:PITA_26642
MGTFDQSKQPEEVALQEAHESTLQKALAVFNSSAMGSGAARQTYEKMVQSTLKKQFEEFKRSAFNEADLKCTSILQNMDKKLCSTCMHMMQNLISLEGPIFDLTKRLTNHSSSKKAALQLKYRLVEDKLALMGKQLEISQKHGGDYLKRYNDAISDKKKISDEYAARLANMQSKYNSLEEKYAHVCEVLDSTRKEASELKKKYDQSMFKQQIEKEHIDAEMASLKTRYSSAETRLSAACEQVASAKEEALEWRRKHDLTVKESQTTLQRATSLHESATKQAQLREDTLRANFSATITQKENEVKDSLTRLENAEHRLGTLNLQLKGQENKIRAQELDIVTLKAEVKDLQEKLEIAKAIAQ